MGFLREEQGQFPFPRPSGFPPRNFLFHKFWICEVKPQSSSRFKNNSPFPFIPGNVLTFRSKRRRDISSRLPSNMPGTDHCLFSGWAQKKNKHFAMLLCTNKFSLHIRSTLDIRQKRFQSCTLPSFSSKRLCTMAPTAIIFLQATCQIVADLALWTDNLSKFHAERILLDKSSGSCCQRQTRTQDSVDTRRRIGQQPKSVFDLTILRMPGVMGVHGGVFLRLFSRSVIAIHVHVEHIRFVCVCEKLLQTVAWTQTPPS